MAQGDNGRKLDAGTRVILEELRDMRVEMREDRRRSDDERRQETLRSDARFERMMREFRGDSGRREAATQKAPKDLRTDLRTVGLAIVKTLNRHTRLLEHISTHHGRLLERIDKKLGTRGNGLPGQGNGGHV